MKIEISREDYFNIRIALVYVIRTMPSLVKDLEAIDERFVEAYNRASDEEFYGKNK